MITAVRLRDRDLRKGWGMLSYTSARSGTRYTTGTHGTPPPVRIVKDRQELAELRGFDQFEITQYANLAELREKVQSEMEQRARIGGLAARAEILGDVAGDDQDGIPDHVIPPMSKEPKVAKPVEEKKSMSKAEKMFGPLGDNDDDDSGDTESEEQVSEATSAEAPKPKKTAKKKSSSKGKGKK